MLRIVHGQSTVLSPTCRRKCRALSDAAARIVEEFVEGVGLDYSIVLKLPAQYPLELNDLRQFCDDAQLERADHILSHTTLDFEYQDLMASWDVYSQDTDTLFVRIGCTEAQLDRGNFKFLKQTTRAQDIDERYITLGDLTRRAAHFLRAVMWRGDNDEDNIEEVIVKYAPMLQRVFGFTQVDEVPAEDVDAADAAGAWADPAGDAVVHDRATHARVRDTHLYEQLLSAYGPRRLGAGQVEPHQQVDPTGHVMPYHRGGRQHDEAV